MWGKWLELWDTQLFIYFLGLKFLSGSYIFYNYSGGKKNPLISSENAPQKIAKGVRAIVYNTTLNTISVISCRSVSFVEETGVPRENHGPVAIHWQTL
jgi:hypothetical protein